MDHFAMLTPHKQLVEIKLNARACSILGFMELCGPLEIPGRPPVVHIESIWNKTVGLKPCSATWNRFPIKILLIDSTWLFTCVKDEDSLLQQVKTTALISDSAGYEYISAVDKSSSNDFKSCK